MPVTTAPVAEPLGPEAIDADARFAEIEALAAGPSVADHVRALARTHGITFERTELDDYAETISRLSDAEVDPDEIELLLRALNRAGVITPERRFALHAAYLRQSGA